MRKDIENIWVFALFSKCLPTALKNLLSLLLIIALAWLVTTFLYWSHPGGPAWGKYYCFRNYLSFLFQSRKSKIKSVIPGPRGFPLVGSMSIMSSHVAHRRIAAVAGSIGAKRLMAFSLGDTRVIVTCHPDVAREILNSPVFSDRPVKESAYGLMFDRAIGFAPYGVYWRTLRKLAANHLFNPKQIKLAEEQRRVIVAQMVDVFARASEQTCGFAVREVIKTASLNNMMGSVFGRQYRLDSYNKEVEELRGLVDEGYQLLGTLNWTDHLPWLTDFDFQTIRFRCSELKPKVNRFVYQMITDHKDKCLGKTEDFVDVLLSLDGPNRLSEPDMIAVLWEMIFRGTDTVAVLIEWILARMVLHEDVQSTVHDELDRVVGRARTVDESQIPSLPYVTALIKEVLRLHPPGPLLSWARLAIADTDIDGHHVPAGTTAMVNMWAITRDPNVWKDPQEFNPERLVTKDGEAEFSVFGSDPRLAPFGSGRRVCPGKNLGFATVTFWVASLLHEFEWLAANEQNPPDLSEILMLSCEMAKHASLILAKLAIFVLPK